MSGITTLRLLMLVAACCAGMSLRAQAAPPLFSEHTAAMVPLAVELAFPVSRLLELADEEVETYPGDLRLQDGTELSLKVSPRGKSRRRQCAFPPLRLNFKKKSTADTIFAGQDKLKLVTHCSDRLARGGYLAAEMLAYRILNRLTPASFRVRALNVTYTDTEGDTQQTWPAFLIEHKDQLAERMQGALLEVESLELSQLDAEYATMVGLFAYMIGNTDFSLRMGPGQSCCHNAVPVQVDSVVFAVPYDFDATGLVNAPYARPAPSTNIRSVTQRIFRGYCEHNGLIEPVANAFLAARSDIMTLVRNFSDVPGLRRERVGNYLEKFFALVAKPQLRDKRTAERCR